MNDNLTKQDLRRLIDPEQDHCLSLYMPAHRITSDIQEDRIRLKNLLTRADERLADAGVGKRARDDRLQVARALLDDVTFWQRQSDGLALFIGADSTMTYRLPQNFEERCVVADRYYIKPLLPLLTGDGHFYILALSKNAVRLFQATRAGVDEMTADALPADFAEALRYDDFESQLQFHTGTGQSGAGGRRAMFHGHGVGSDDEKDTLLRFCRAVARGVDQALEGEHAPLVLACVDYLMPIYREANHYAHLLEKGVSGNPDDRSAEELQKAAWTLVEPRFTEDRRQALANYPILAEKEQATDDLDAVTTAAHDGRIDTAFVQLDAEIWGRFDPASRAVTVDDEPATDSQDLLDAIAVQTLLNGGTVYALPAGDMPTDSATAALLRY